MRRVAIAAALIALMAVSCISNDSTEEAAPTTTEASQLGEDPSAPPTTDPDAAQLSEELVRQLEADGHEVSRLKARDPEGGRLFGMTHSWVVRVAGVETFVNLFQNSEALTDWAATAKDLGGVVVFDPANRWALSLDSDVDRPKSARLAREIGRGLTDWAPGIRVIT